MPTRTIVLTALIASCVSSALTLAAALLILAPASRAAPESQAVQPVLRAERFELIDGTGAVRATLNTERHGVGLALRDEGGAQRVALILDPDALNGLFVVDPATRAMAFVGSSASDPSSFAMRVTNAEGRAALVRAASEGVGFVATDPGNQPRARMGLDQRGVAGVEVGNSLLDPNSPRAAVLQAPGAAPRIAISDDLGQPTWEAP